MLPGGKMTDEGTKTGDKEM